MADRFNNQVARIDARIDHLLEQVEAGEDIQESLRTMEILLPLDVMKLGMAFVLDSGDVDREYDDGTTGITETVLHGNQ